jgi:hypothetical protein
MADCLKNDNDGTVSRILINLGRVSGTHCDNVISKCFIQLADGCSQAHVVLSALFRHIDVHYVSQYLRFLKSIFNFQREHYELLELLLLRVPHSLPPDDSNSLLDLIEHDPKKGFEVLRNVEVARESVPLIGPYLVKRFLNIISSPNFQVTEASIQSAHHYFQQFVVGVSSPEIAQGFVYFLDLYFQLYSRTEERRQMIFGHFLYFYRALREQIRMTALLRICEAFVLCAS